MTASIPAKPVIRLETGQKGKNAERKEQIMQYMREYCKLDTLAMVEIYDKLISIDG